jgi:preprotein translocase subunit YajC
MSLFMAEAYAAAQPTTQASSLPTMVMLGVFAVVFYFMVYRPQASRAKAQQKLLASISKGDEVLTSGGLMGRVSRISSDDSCVRLALQDNVEVAVKKEFITAILPKGTLKSL